MKVIQILILGTYISLAHAHPQDSTVWIVENVNSCQECVNLTCHEGKKVFSKYFFYQFSFFDGGEGAQAPIANEKNCPFVNISECNNDPGAKCTLLCEVQCI